MRDKRTLFKIHPIIKSYWRFYGRDPCSQLPGMSLPIENLRGQGYDNGNNMNSIFGIFRLRKNIAIERMKNIKTD